MQKVSGWLVVLEKTVMFRFSFRKLEISAESTLRIVNGGCYRMRKSTTVLRYVKRSAEIERQVASGAAACSGRAAFVLAIAFTTSQ